MRMLTVSLLLLGVMLMPIAPTAQTGTPPPLAESTYLQHIVMYKFKPEVSAEQVQEVVNAFLGLRDKVNANAGAPGIVLGIQHGLNTSREGKSEGLTHIFVVTFENEAGLATYLKHPAHDAYVQIVKDRREKVVVFDYLVPRRPGPHIPSPR
jgi:quinol monooxygenase YgiN